MIKHFLILPDGTKISSGVAGEWAIRSVQLTQKVNSAQALTPGSVCAGLLEAEIWAPEGALPQSEQALQLWQEEEGGRQRQLGVFYTEKPTRQSRNVYKLTAYDAVRRLDKELSQWLEGLDGWPYRLQELAGMVCRACGLELEEQQLPNGEYPVRKFSARGITGRQLMEWIGQISGRFCRATEQGSIRLDWYEDNENYSLGPTQAEGIRQSFADGYLSWESTRLEAYPMEDGLQLQIRDAQVGDDGAGNAELTIRHMQTQIPCFQGGLSYADYTVMPIDSVRLRQNPEDVGTVWPEQGGENSYIVTGNYLLSADSAQALLPVAEKLYEQLATLSYTPCRAVIPAGADIRPGQRLQVNTADGKTMTCLVMSRQRRGQKEILECTGSQLRQTDQGAQTLGFQALNGKVMNLAADLDGLKAENKDSQGKLSRLELDLAGIRSGVADQEGRMTGLEQTAQAIRVSIGAVQQNLEGLQEQGAAKVATQMGYTLDDRGLQINRAGEEITNLLDHTGMYVRRSGDVMLQANSRGVVARDVTVHNYLVIGDFARLEDYSDGSDQRRTACFYLGG